MKDKIFEIIVFGGSLLENDKEVFYGLVIQPLVDQWFETHEGFIPNA